MDYLWLVYAVIGAAFGWFFASQWLVPWKKASMLRSFTRKDYEVAFVRKGGGQIKGYVVDRSELPLIKTSKNESFVPNDKISNWIGSVRIHFFNDTDVNELDLNREQQNEFLIRNPKQLDSYILIVKTFFRTFFARNQQLLFYVACGALAAGAAAAFFGYQNHNDIIAMQQKIDFVSSVVNQTLARSSAELPNLAG